VRIIGYIRVSTDRQAEEGLGLEVQERAIRSWARQEGHRLMTSVRQAHLIHDRERDAFRLQ
jgi:DNA invertase Pin-like site-specific DNA recombinase